MFVAAAVGAGVISTASADVIVADVGAAVPTKHRYYQESHTQGRNATFIQRQGRTAPVAEIQQQLALQ